jgi:hypothetical protein
MAMDMEGRAPTDGRHLLDHRIPAVGLLTVNLHGNGFPEHLEDALFPKANDVLAVHVGSLHQGTTYRNNHQ